MRIDEVTGGAFTLGRGPAMPRIGLGTWPLDDAEAQRVVADALTAGYRLVDTAENYGNERGVGAGIRASGLPRDEVFVTTKFNREWHSVAGAAAAFEASAERLGVEYVDLLLIHWPNPDQDRYVEAWQGLIALHCRGARARDRHVQLHAGAPGPPAGRDRAAPRRQPGAAQSALRPAGDPRVRRGCTGS